MADTDDRDPVDRAARLFFGLPYLFPYQRLVVANILEAAEARGFPLHWPGINDAGNQAGPGEDRERESLGRQIVILPTGAGKSLCFQLPAMLLPGPTLAVYPLLSLMADQERRLRERGFPPVTLRGGQSREERDALWKKLRSGESRFIIATPEVLLSGAVMDRLGEIGIVHVVIDEAHCVSEWGERFRPAYRDIGKVLKALKGPGGAMPLVTAFTATASARVLERIETSLFGAGVRRIAGNPDRSNIRYAAQGCLLRDLAVRDLLRIAMRPAVVFCSSRPGTEKLARYLRNDCNGGDEHDAGEIRFYHAGLNREERAAIEAWFFRSRGGVLVSTCAYGMGVDKADIRTVIHRDCPPSVEAYLQESGRAGRDGQPSRGILLWGPDDGQAMMRAKTPEGRERLASLLAYARDTGGCRRATLLHLLNYEGAGDSPETACCDVCEGTARSLPREEPVLADFFQRNRRRYTLAGAVKILAASRHLAWSDDEAKQAVTLLLREGRLRILKNPLWKDRITYVPRGKAGVSKGTGDLGAVFPRAPRTSFS
ncbi:MAG: RecQ family ATP-dependent DNA helicase [Treponema sp.]|jgi:ATP-dependent DNA helicase RecQ|nr:RecQ family ATP-dependent DNA helicase [Treponema sp.]